MIPVSSFHRRRRGCLLVVLWWLPCSSSRWLSRCSSHDGRPRGILLRSLLIGCFGVWLWVLIFLCLARYLSGFICVFILCQPSRFHLLFCFCRWVWVSNPNHDRTRRPSLALNRSWGSLCNVENAMDEHSAFVWNASYCFSSFFSFCFVWSLSFLFTQYILQVRSSTAGKHHRTRKEKEWPQRQQQHKNEKHKEPGNQLQNCSSNPNSKVT